MNCFNCGSDTGNLIYGIPVCTLCESDLRLFTDETIIRQKLEYKGSGRYPTYKDEVSDRLVIMEKDYLRKKIKLLHILDRIEHLEHA